MNMILAIVSEYGIVIPGTLLAGYAVKELIGIRERLAKIEQRVTDIAENCPGCEDQDKPKTGLMKGLMQ